MKKVELINPDNYFVESKKAVQIALEKERSLYGDLPKKNKLDLLRKRKKETKSEEEYEAIEKLEKKLEREIKFNHPIPLVPDKYKKIIRKNAEIEAEEVNKKLKESREELKKQLPYLQNVVLPLLLNIEKFKNLIGVKDNVDIIADYEFHDGNFLRADNFIRTVSPTRRSKTAVDLEKIIKAIEKI